jgi:multiple sugar transport system permease protein
MVPGTTVVFTFFVPFILLAAFSILYSLPVVMLYTLAQRMLGNAFALQGAVKG